jgi:uncharacterized protein YigA (DUF484 family)
MSHQHKLEQRATPTISEDDIAEYLSNHPDFFERHMRVLARLRLPHATNGATVSLVERQITVLREKNDQLQRSLKNLVTVAKHNDALVGKIHRLALALISVPSIAARLDKLEHALREDFAAERAMLVLFESAPAVAKIDPMPGFLIIADRDDDALKPFSTLIKSGKTRCGPLRERQQQYLFGTDGDALGSAAMVPLGKATSLGFLAIGNRNRDYFNPGERTDFLDRLGELIATAIQHGQPQE